jgi:alpha-L-arabinofuranosidase
MKKIISICAFFVLTGCATSVPVNMSWPQVPEDLTQSCPALQQIDSNTTKLSDVISVVSKNYEQYQNCQTTVDGWNAWYKTQKQIFESVK